MTGNVDAGKSTLLGVLTHGVLDDGRGVARQKLFRHKHELETGRTSSVGNVRKILTSREGSSFSIIRIFWVSMLKVELSIDQMRMEIKHRIG